MDSTPAHSITDAQTQDYRFKTAPSSSSSSMSGQDHHRRSKYIFIQESTSPESGVVTRPTRRSNSTFKLIRVKGYAHHLLGAHRADPLGSVATRKDVQRQPLP
ncbi:hypothetical protein KIN20_018573 [Parelaphostrongylus tenuis]|uniref:Uncharacterized protein n=1 Tax=Parelaphostrongylus tenuis TaxID=148309 RepID=A0AAD5QRI3_PARTN|nr:hypothetical protein KIN20_018573 [Parelaphostrongylus tenuis]